MFVCLWAHKPDRYDVSTQHCLRVAHCTEDFRPLPLSSAARPLGCDRQVGDGGPREKSSGALTHFMERPPGYGASVGPGRTGETWILLGEGTMAISASSSTSVRRERRLSLFRALRDVVLRRDLRAQTWLSLGRFFMRLHRSRAALRLYRRATSLDPHNCRLWRHHAAAAVRSGRLGEASLCYRTLVRLDPGNPRAHARVAATYDLIGSQDAALQACRTALERFPDAACLHRQLGQILLNMGSVHGALRALERAAELSPRHGDTHYFVGLALRRAGRIKDARAALKRALSLRPDDPKLYYALGLCCKPGEVSGEAESSLLAGLAIEQVTADLAPPRWISPVA